MFTFNHLTTAAAAVALSCAVIGTDAMAQAYPSKPIRMILPFPAGAPSDLVGRFIGQKMGEQMGHNMLPDNRVGAGGTLALSLAATSPADGYTVLVTSPTIAISPALYKKTQLRRGQGFRTGGASRRYRKCDGGASVRAGQDAEAVH